MFQRLDQLRAGTLVVITGEPGAGKSHLAASARQRGTVWVLDTEGAAHHLINKPGIHAQIQAVQSLSLRQLLEALREVKRVGKAGDTVVLDSISKVLQAMRSYAQQRAGGDTDRKAALSYDEHASVNRNMQALYTALTELKQQGMHVVLIGHLAKKYETNGRSLSDVGLRVLADANIAYEADAVLLVQRQGAKRTVTPIIKPPRLGHLELDKTYPATIGSLYPDQAVTEEGGSSAAEAPANVTAFPSVKTTTAPKTPREAEQRFYHRYGPAIGGTTWADVETFLGYSSEHPKTIDDWVQVAEEVRGRLRPPDHQAAS